jgi:nanoRNase/pAp phosphatase (c-di-AMP/oligoRNAs hydrolase)
MDNPKNQLISKIKASNAILVTVSTNPSVDQLAACIGLTILVNKLKKHGSAVFSGQIPSTIEFLKPESTIEKNTDSLRDFIIALDKEKADKLRFKADGPVVKIFITPYRTSLSENDLDFSQGDFNVDLIIALGVKNKEEIDQAIVSHGNILHDATVASITLSDISDVGSINWVDQQASSLCELIAEIAKGLGDKLIDDQIATALLTGIVAETDRFSNDKTTPQTMSVSSELMNAGANQQLIASELSVTNNSSHQSSSPQSHPVKDQLQINHDLDTFDPVNQSDLKEPDMELPPIVGADTVSFEAPDDASKADSSQVEPNSPNPSESTVPITTVADTPGATINETSSSAQASLGTANNLLNQEQTLNPVVPPSTDSLSQNNSQEETTSPSYSPPPSDWQPPQFDDTPNSPIVPKPNDTTDQADNLVNNSEQSNTASQVDPLGPVGLEEPEGSILTHDNSHLNIMPDQTNISSDLVDQNNELTEALKEEGNATGLDPSLFSEPPKETEIVPDGAPPVPPPVIQLPFNNDSNST